MHQLKTQKMQHEIEKDEASFAFSAKDDIYAVASLLKVQILFSAGVLILKRYSVVPARVA